MATELPPKPQPKPKNKNLIHRNNLASRTPEERSALSRKAALSRKKHKRVGRTPGTPNDWTNKEYAPLREEARLEARRMVKLMEKEGLLPQDPIAREALLTVLQAMREPGPKDFKHKAARTLLEYTMAKPSQKQDITVRSAEDFLNELADEADEPTSD